jgi:hypothetical protein
MNISADGPRKSIRRMRRAGTSQRRGMFHHDYEHFLLCENLGVTTSRVATTAGVFNRSETLQAAGACRQQA